MKKPRLLYLNICVFLITGLFAIIGVPIEAILNGFDSVEITACILLIGFSGMSITAGYHRLWSHKTYETNGVIKVILALGGALALQNSILHWASDHRIHHKHVDDNDRDPYSAKKGFWYSHIGWMLREYQAHRYNDYSNCRDLQKDGIVMWQHKHYLLLTVSTNFGIPLLLGWLNGDIIGMLLLAGFLRLVIAHHVTFFINSAAHIWGKQPYTDKNTARDNGILAFFTFGEGYHNFHHIFEYDYRNGIKWWQFDPTKWLIKTWSILGLAKNLRKCPEERIEKAKLAMQLKRTQDSLAKLPNAEELIAKMQYEYDVLLQRMSEFYSAKKRLVDIKKRKLKRSYDKLELNQKCKELQQALVQQQKRWALLHQTQFA